MPHIGSGHRQIGPRGGRPAASRPTPRLDHHAIIGGAGGGVKNRTGRGGPATATPPPQLWSAGTCGNLRRARSARLVRITDHLRRGFLHLPPGVRRRVLHGMGRYAPWEAGFDFTPPPVGPGEETGPPDFVGIGVQKAGTTWWFELVLTHPDVSTPPGRPQGAPLLRPLRSPVHATTGHPAVPRMVSETDGHHHRRVDARLHGLPVGPAPPEAGRARRPTPRPVAGPGRAIPLGSGPRRRARGRPGTAG